MWQRAITSGLKGGVEQLVKPLRSSWLMRREPPAATVIVDGSLGRFALGVNAVGCCCCTPVPPGVAAGEGPGDMAAAMLAASMNAVAPAALPAMAAE